jgi:2',3'-cyclic-nucleotide 2'-phosphodiesterase/3'-nucleotidase
MRRPFVRPGAVALLAVALSAAPAHGADAVAAPQQLTLLHTSDLHGQVLPFDDARGLPTAGSLVQVASIVAEIRRASGHPVLLVDSGDTIQGAPLEQFVHVRWREPSPTIDAMNLIGYDAMAVGNHEFNFGLEVLRRAESQAAFPFLSANTVDERSGAPAFPPFRVIEAGPVRVGVLGLTTPNIPGWESPANYRGLRFEAMDAAARRWVAVLRDRERCDLVVVLAHTGFERDPASGLPDNTEYENFAWRLTRVPGIDVLLTGHSHREVSPQLISGVIVAQPLARARLVTRIDLWLEPAGGGFRVARWEGANLKVAGAPADPELEGRFGPLRRRVAEALDAPVTRVAEPVSVRGCRLADCAALDLVHEVQLAASGAELSLASLLSDGTPDLAAGPLAWRWVHGLYVYPNTLQSVVLSGAQVKDLLEHAARYYDGLECGADGGWAVLTDPEVRHYNVDTMAGLDYRIDPTRPEGDRVCDLRFRGRPLDLHARFNVVCNNYRAAGGGGYPHLAAAEVVWRSSAEVTDLIGEYLTGMEEWQPTVDGNWWIAPTSPTEAASPGVGER